MTFDLLFYRREPDSNLDAAAVIAVVSRNPNFAVSQIKNGYDLLYENKLTGVYFVTHYSPQDATPSFPGFKPTDLSAHVNYARPTYFALEAFPAISALAHDLSLLVLDNQVTSKAKTPSEPDAHALIESWIASNELGVKAAWSRGERIFYMPRERLDYLWKYLSSTTSLQQAVDVFVPTKVFAFKDKSNRVVTCSLWPNYMPQIFPVVDFVLIGAKSQAGSKLKGFARFSQIAEVLGHDLKEVKEPMQHFLLSKDLSGQTIKNLDRIPLISVQEFSVVPWDTIVDVTA